jgi:hypothetical protein
MCPEILAQIMCGLYPSLREVQTSGGSLELIRLLGDGCCGNHPDGQVVHTCHMLSSLDGHIWVIDPCLPSMNFTLLYAVAP